MPLERGSDGDRELFDDLYDNLQRPERRRILFNLLEHNPQAAVVIAEDIHIGGKKIGQLNLELVHNHLPKLEQAGLIRWERDTEEIHKGPNFEAVRELLFAIRKHDPVELERSDGGS